MPTVLQTKHSSLETSFWLQTWSYKLLIAQFFCNQYDSKTWLSLISNWLLSHVCTKKNISLVNSQFYCFQVTFVEETKNCVNPYIELLTVWNHSPCMLTDLINRCVVVFSWLYLTAMWARLSSLQKQSHLVDPLRFQSQSSSWQLSSSDRKSRSFCKYLTRAEKSSPESFINLSLSEEITYAVSTSTANASWWMVIARVQNVRQSSKEGRKRVTLTE